MQLRTLTDRLEITDLLTAYATAVDGRDWERYRSIFTPDAVIDYSSAGGAVGTPDEMADYLEQVLAQFRATQHMIGNLEVDIDGDTARARAMFHNPMRMADGSVWFTGGWYNHELVRTPDGWRSRRLIEETSYFSGRPDDGANPPT